MADILWTGVEVDISVFGGDYLKGMRCIPALLKDRPEVHTRIKYLTIELDLGELHRLQKILELEEFSQLCGSISSKFDLDELKLYMTVDEDDIEHSLKLLIHPSSAVVAAIRSFQVKSFFLSLFIYVPYDEQVFAVEGEREDHEFQLQNKYESTFAEVLMPDSLRERPASNEMEAHLWLRLGARELDGISTPE